jgi:hypothetical protein
MGTYLLRFLVLCSPHFRILPNQGYPGRTDEFATVNID